MMNETEKDSAWLELIFDTIENPAALELVPPPPASAAAPVKTTRAVACPKCGGSGKLYEFRHVSGGVCFRCNGARFIQA